MDCDRPLELLPGALFTPRAESGPEVEQLFGVTVTVIDPKPGFVPVRVTDGAAMVRADALALGPDPAELTARTWICTTVLSPWPVSATEVAVVLVVLPL